MTSAPDSRPGPQTRQTPRPWLVRLTTTVTAWLVAFLVVSALLSLFGEQLGSLPLVVRALIISGVLVALMANVVMPILGRLTAHWHGAPAARRSADG